MDGAEGSATAVGGMTTLSCRVCSGRGWYWCDHQPHLTGGHLMESLCHSCSGTGQLSPLIVAIIGILQARHNAILALAGQMPA